MPYTALRWRRFQQQSGWPFGLVTTIIWMVGVPALIMGIMVLLEWASP